jgi:hypothetical protein
MQRRPNDRGLRIAVLLVLAGLGLPVACSDDDAPTPGSNAGAGGSMTWRDGGPFRMRDGGPQGDGSTFPRDGSVMYLDGSPNHMDGSFVQPMDGQDNDLDAGEDDAGDDDGGR